MTRTARLVLLCAGSALAVTSCRRDKDSSAKAALATDTALASDLREVATDTSQYAAAADVAMATLPDSAILPRRGVNQAPMRVSGPLTVQRPATAQKSRTVQGSLTVQEPLPQRAAPSATASRRPIAVPSAPMDVRPSIPLPTSGATMSAAPATAAGDPCASPASTDQRRCLLAYLARSDVGLDRTYQSVIAEMKRAAGSAPGDREPDSVRQLRDAQRAWLVYRDTECRRRTIGQEGALWAPVRAKCLAEYSQQREEELAVTLAKLQGR